MSITLTPETQAKIEALMRRDGYPSADDVVHAALQLLDERDDLDGQTLAAIEEGEAQIERGEYQDWSNVSAKLRAKYLGR